MCKMISEDECRSILKKSMNEDVKLLNYQVDSASDENVGFLGEYYNLICEIENVNGNHKKIKFFIKSLPVLNLKERALIENFGIFKKEVAVYKLLEDFSKYCNIKFHPTCYYTRSDILVLEDLLGSEYFKLSEDIEYNLNQIKGVLSALACLHASSIAFETKNDISIENHIESKLFETSVDNKIDWFLVGLEAVKLAALKHPKFQSKDHQNFIKNMFLEKIQPVYEMVNASSEFRNVLCHRDAWGGNIFFKTDENNNSNSLTSALVDFQTCRYSPPAIDVLFFLHLNTKRSFRDTIYEECLQYYYDQLKSNLIEMKIPDSNHISINEFLRSCKHLKLFAVLYDCIAATIVQLPKGFLQNLKRNHPDKYYKFANVSRNDIISKFLIEDPHFREYINETIEELMEIIYK